MSKNSGEFKRILEYACKRGEATLQSHQSHRNKYPEAYVILSLLDGYSYGKSRFILQEAVDLLSEVSQTSTINAEQVFQTIVPLNL